MASLVNSVNINGNSPVPSISPTPNTASILTSNLSSFRKQLKAAHINAESLRGHIDEVRAIFISQIFDIIAISESWLKPSINSNEVALSGYKLYRNDRLNKKCGGVAVYLKDHLKVKVLYETPKEYAAKPEFMFIDIGLSCADNLLFGVCYRPPKIGHLAEFENIFLRFLPNYSNVLIMGDLNTDLLMKTHNYDFNQLTSMFNSCNMTVLPLNATHHTAESHTLIDLIITNDPNSIVHFGQLPIPAISKHDLIYCVSTCKTPKPKERFIKYREFKSIDEVAFLADVLNTPWDTIENQNSVQDMVKVLNALILGLYDKHCPVVRKRVNKRHPVPWLTQDILDLMAQRDAVYRRARRTSDAVTMELYRQLRNRVKQLLRNSKLRYINSLFVERNQSSCEVWRNVKKIGFGKQPSSVSVDIPLNELNDYFLSHSRSSNSLLLQNHLSHVKNMVPQTDFHFEFKRVLQVDTLRVIRRIRTNAMGSDNISIYMIKKILFAILPALTIIFNKSLETGIFPEQWKYALVRPLNKVPLPSRSQDYRPISILPVLSKGLERLVHCQISDFMLSQNIFNPFQSGFRQYHSTETALLRITDDIRFAMDQRQCTILTLFDFSKAFDTVNHDLLIAKLKYVGFSDRVICWMRSYLNGRQQCISVDESTSEWMPVICGVPQGSILGPLLFAFYVNDISSVLTYTKFHCYADDLQIYAHCTVDNLNQTVDNINLDIERIFYWAQQHGLRLNPDKTKSIVIGYSRLLNTFNLNNIHQVTVNGTIVPYCTSVNSLGLTITNTLDWTEHIVGICNKVFAALHTLKKMNRFLPFHIKLLLIKSLVFPYFNYCNSVINDMTVILANKLQRSQNYCMRFLFNIRRIDEHITPYYTQNSILKLSQLRYYKILILLYSILQYGLPKYFINDFHFINDERSVRETRSGASLLRIPHHRTIMFNKSFIVTACRLWNSLPLNIKSCRSLGNFKLTLKNYFLEQITGTDMPDDI